MKIRSEGTKTPHYEDAAIRLADFTVAVPAPWSGQRQYMTHQEAFELLANRPRLRTPDDPENKTMPMNRASSLKMQKSEENRPV